MKKTKLFIFLSLFSSCAVLHHVQLGELDNTNPIKLDSFEIKVSETGINLDEAADIAKAISRSKKADESIERVQSIIALFQMGPKTGNPVYDDTYAENVITLIHDECPSGKITGLTTIRETRKYPVISGEIIKVKGFCIK